MTEIIRQKVKPFINLFKMFEFLALMMMQSNFSRKKLYTNLKKNIQKIPYKFNLKTGAKMMLAINIDIQNRVINGQKGDIRYTKFAGGSFCKVYVKFFDQQADSKAMRSSYFGRKKFQFSIEKCEAEISIKKGSASPFIKRTQFPLARASNVHKVQSFTLEQGPIDFDIWNQKLFGLGQIYTVFSRVIQKFCSKST